METAKKILGLILLAPGVISVFIFILQILGKDLLDPIFYNNYTWRGDGDGFTSAVPFYFGLMAIAGAILLFNTKKE